MTVTFLSSHGLKRGLEVPFVKESRCDKGQIFSGQEDVPDQQGSNCKSLCHGGRGSGRRTSLLTQFSAKSIDRKVRVLSKKIE